ncbi:hypothetical protein H2201_000944 [Coniosporium apollinis]|uniref:Major facilitator superfamily (MFS) profile domain-containing protein n=2 Tax=Coniosporium TaxID=2810619 RepID=A0ABQ9P4A8_9PEZI|nr:hypothetical protein H2199_001468 [Cladosporium sp. JES 115]KAJ9669118.1 hypothetical protein H2201_000944 [Coniosporium apollinis]
MSSDSSTVCSKEIIEVIPKADSKGPSHAGYPIRVATSLERPETPDSESLAPFNPGWRFYLAFASLSIISLMAALDATSLSVALPIMAKALKGTAIQAFWSGTSFLLTSTVFLPVLGSFSHVFGRKPIILVSLALFAAGAIIAAVANNFTVLLVGRSVQGIGGGGIICMSEMVVTDLVPLRERGKWFSFIGSMWAIGTVVGPLLGGGFAHSVSWRWIFWINLPFIGIGAPMVVFFLNLHYKNSSLLAKLKRIDWIGTVVFLGATTGFLIPISWGGVMYDWTSWRTLTPLIVCGAALVGFVFYEEYVASEPLIRLSVFKSRTAAVTYLGTFCHGVLLWCILYYIPLYFEAVKGLTPVTAGVALFSQTFVVPVMSIVTGTAISITGHWRWAVWTGWFLTTLGCGILIKLEEDTSTVGWVFMNIISGLGTGMLFPSMAMATQASASNEDQAHAVAMFTFIRAFGQTVGVAVGGVIFQNQMKKQLLMYPLLADMAEEYSRDASGLVEIIKHMPDGLEQKLQLRIAYTDALERVWYVLCVISFIAFVASFWIRPLALDRALETEQGFIHEQKETDAEKNKA